MWNLNEILREDVTYDKIKSQKKSGTHPISRKYIFGKATEGFRLTPPLPAAPSRLSALANIK